MAAQLTRGELDVSHKRKPGSRRHVTLLTNKPPAYLVVEARMSKSLQLVTITSDSPRPTEGNDTSLVKVHIHFSQNSLR